MIDAMRRPRTASLTALALAAACGAGSEHTQDVATATRSTYDAEAAVVLNGVREAAATRSERLIVDPARKTVATYWQQLPLLDEDKGKQSPKTDTSRPMHLTKRYFIRFDVAVVGGRPWRVEVIGHAGAKDPGPGAPVELTGDAEPGWLRPRTDDFRVAIYEHLKPYAVSTMVTAAPGSPHSSDMAPPVPSDAAAGTP
jgi:hypothetical protein